MGKATPELTPYYTPRLCLSPLPSWHWRCLTRHWPFFFTARRKELIQADNDAVANSVYLAYTAAKTMYSERLLRDTAILAHVFFFSKYLPMISQHLVFFCQQVKKLNFPWLNSLRDALALDASLGKVRLGMGLDKEWTHPIRAALKDPDGRANVMPAKLLLPVYGSLNRHNYETHLTGFSTRLGIWSAMVSPQYPPVLVLAVYRMYTHRFISIAEDTRILEIDDCTAKLRGLVLFLYSREVPLPVRELVGTNSLVTCAMERQWARNTDLRLPR